MIRRVSAGLLLLTFSGQTAVSLYACHRLGGLPSQGDRAFAPPDAAGSAHGVHAPGHALSAPAAHPGHARMQAPAQPALDSRDEPATVEERSLSSARVGARDAPHGCPWRHRGPCPHQTGGALHPCQSDLAAVLQIHAETGLPVAAGPRLATPPSHSLPGSVLAPSPDGPALAPELPPPRLV